MTDRRVYICQLLLSTIALTACQKHYPVNPTPAPHARTVHVSWTASTTPNVSYNVYRQSAPCAASGTFAKINAGPISGTSYDDLNVPAGSTYCYYATAVCSTCSPSESAPSNKDEAQVQDVQPQPPTGLTVSPAAVTLKIGAQQQFAARRGTEPVAATWSVDPAEGSVSSTGLYRAPATIQGNNVRVQVLAQDGAGSGTAEITIRK